MAMLTIGDQVTIRNMKMPPEKFHGIVNGVDAESGHYTVTRLNKARNSVRCEPWEMLGSKGVRMDDGTPCRDTEDYVIEAVTGTSADLLQALTAAAKEVQALRAENKTFKQLLTEYDAKGANRFKALCETLASFSRDDEMTAAMKKTMETGLPQKAKPVIEPQKRALQNA